jgi:hypothetical protein
VDEANQSGKAKRIRVLRARDVIPPFDRCVPPADQSEIEAGLPQAEPVRATDGEGCLVPADAPGVTEPLPVDDGQIPAYDLAENILAEQRRVAGRRRRRLSRAEEPVVSPGETATRTTIPDLGSQDLLELQRIVAEIVARDIERLCRKPDRPVDARRMSFDGPAW